VSYDYEAGLHVSSSLAVTQPFSKFTPAMLKVFLVLGGLTGPDGYAVSPGMLTLAYRLTPFGQITTYRWTSQREVTRDIAHLDPNDKIGIRVEASQLPGLPISSMATGRARLICSSPTTPRPPGA
jgi:hypothetical protein